MMLLLALGGCAREEKVVGYKPFFAGLSGQGDVTVTGPGAQIAAAASTPGALETITEDQARSFSVNPDGTKKLTIRGAREMIGHLRSLLAAQEKDVPEAAELFFEQVLSPETRGEFESRGMGPEEAFAFLKAEEEDLLQLFSRMPMGEHTPTAVTEDLGKNTQRVRLTRDASKGLRWVGLDMVLSRGRLAPAIDSLLGAGGPTVTPGGPTDVQKAIAAARTREEAEDLARKAAAAQPRYTWERGQWGLRWFVPGE